MLAGGVQKFLLDWVTVSHRLNEKIEYTWYVPLKMQDEGLLKEFHTQGVKVIVADIPSSYNKLERTKKFRRDISSILKTDKFDIVHVNTGAFWVQEFAIKEAKNANVRVRIAHSHNAFTDVSIGKRLIYAVWRKELLKNATNLAACSLKAGKWMFGDECGCYIVKNRIDVDKYKFDAEKRELRRREINVSDDEILIGTVGTVNEQKNHAFLLPIIYELRREGLPVKLCIVGRGGEYKDNLFNRVEEMNLGDSVVYCGVSNVVEEWLSAMDLFVMPSIYEGFGIAALEAQASGLSCLLSSAFPVEVAVSCDVKFLPLNVDAWISAIKEWAVNRRRSTNGIEKVEQAGYGIESMLDDVKYLYF